MSRAGTELGRVRGLGSAKKGARDWMLQRITAVANLALLTWLAASLIFGDVSTYEGMHRWLSSPLAAAPLALLAVSVFTHIRLGLTVLIEDYVHAEGAKMAALVANIFFTWGGMIFALFAILKIAIGAVTNAGQ